MIRHVVAVIALVVLCSCGQQSPRDDSFRVYLLREFDFAEYPEEPFDFDPHEFDLESVELPVEPWIREDAVVAYQWPQHIVRVDGSVEEVLPEHRSHGMAFMVVAGGDRRYIGTLWSPLSSFRPPRVPIIHYADVEDDDSFTIHRTYVGDEVPDVRNDPEVYESLKALGKLSEERRNP